MRAYALLLLVALIVLLLSAALTPSTKLGQSGSSSSSSSSSSSAAAASSSSSASTPAPTALPVFASVEYRPDNATVSHRVEARWNDATREFVESALRVSPEVFEALSAGIRAAAADGRVIFTFSNARGHPTLRLWYESLVAHARNKTHGVLIAALDAETVALAKELGAHHIDARLLCPTAVDKGETRASFYRAVNCKPLLWNVCLRAGVDTMMLDSDILIVNDPWERYLAQKDVPKFAMQCGERGGRKESRELLTSFPVWPNAGVMVALAGEPDAVRISAAWTAELRWWNEARDRGPSHVAPRPYGSRRIGASLYSLYKMSKTFGRSGGGLSRRKRKVFYSTILRHHAEGTLTIEAAAEATRRVCSAGYGERETAEGAFFSCSVLRCGPFTPEEWAARNTTKVPDRAAQCLNLRTDGFDGSKFAEQEIIREIVQFEDMVPRHVNFQCLNKPLWRFAFEIPGDAAGCERFLEESSLVHFTSKALSTGNMENKANAMRASRALGNGTAKERCARRPA